MIEISFAEWVKKKREDQKMSQAELARRAKISKSEVTRIEKRQRMPEPKTMRDLAIALRESIEEAFIAAGLLPPKLNSDGELGKWEYVLSQLSEEDRQWLLQIAYLRLDQQEKKVRGMSDLVR